MDRPQHQRFLAYLKKYEYFGRGRPRLAAGEFAALDDEFARLDPSDGTAGPRRADVLALLLRD